MPLPTQKDYLASGHLQRLNFDRFIYSRFAAPPYATGTVIIASVYGEKLGSMFMKCWRSLVVPTPFCDCLYSVSSEDTRHKVSKVVERNDQKWTVFIPIFGREDLNLYGILLARFAFTTVWRSLVKLIPFADLRACMPMKQNAEFAEGGRLSGKYLQK